MIAVFCAMEQEMIALKKGIKINRFRSVPEYTALEGKYGSREGLLVLTGVGKEKAEQAVGRVLQDYPVSLVISAGFGGALNEKMLPGDVLVYSGLKCAGINGSDLPAGPVTLCDAKLAARAVQRPAVHGLRVVPGNGVTVASVCATPESKIDLGRNFQADVVDMESYWIGRMAADRGLPFLAVRSILDAVRDDLSFLDCITFQGKIVFRKVLFYFLMHPGQLREVYKLWRNYRKASKNLSVFMEELMESLV
jgi:adenosylhomocysteine nucleosidase